MAAFEQTHSKQKSDEDTLEIISNIMRMKNPRRLNRDTVLILDFLFNTIHDNDEDPLMYNVGSAFEGTDIFGSDIDNLILRKDLIICQSKEEVNKQNGIVFLMDHTNCHPGYTKLKLMRNDNCEELYQRVLEEEGFVEKIENTETSIYLLTNKLIDNAMEIMSKKFQSRYITRHGPCVTFDMKPTHGFRYSFSKAIDFAQGIELQTVTKVGEHWLKIMDSTQKERIWPTADTIKKIRALKNEVVAVSPGDDTLSDPSWKGYIWRISYTLWERELVWSFKYVQIHCFVTLKVFLEWTLKTISKDLTSYHLKNIVFWESVNSSLEMFENRKFPLLFKKCLIRLKMAINSKRLNHFIDRDRNLFLFKFEDEKAKLEIISCLDKLIMYSSRYLHQILNCLADHHLPTFSYNKGSKPSGSLCKSGEDRPRRDECVERILKCLEHGFNALEIKYIVFFIKDGDTIRSFIDTFDAMEKIGFDSAFVKTVQNVIHFRNWLITAAKNPDMDLPCEYYTDALSGQLYFCSYLVRYGRFQEAADVICNFLESCPKLLIYCGLYRYGEPYNGIHVEKGQANHIQIETSSIDVSDNSFVFIHDVIANPLEIDIFPPVIQIQIALDDACIVLSPIVFMYYLKVVCDIRVNGNADHSLQNLADTVNQHCLKIGDFRPLNMLGHAYLLTKRYEDAYRSFFNTIHLS